MRIATRDNVCWGYPFLPFRVFPHIACVGITPTSEYAAVQAFEVIRHGTALSGNRHSSLARKSSHLRYHVRADRGRSGEYQTNGRRDEGSSGGIDYSRNCRPGRDKSAQDFWCLPRRLFDCRRRRTELDRVLHAARQFITSFRCCHRPRRFKTLAHTGDFVSASPGTITGVITLAVVHTKLSLPVTALVAVAVATAIMWVAMVLLGRQEARPGGGLLHDTVTRFMGLIVVAMGTQFALTGARDFFTASPQ